MSTDAIRMSSKGQIVIPQEIREEINATEGTLFSVIGARDTVILKKITKPSKEDLIKELEIMAREGKRHLQSLGIKESDIPRIVERRRRKKNEGSS